jgi:hypothetical protein
MPKTEASPSATHEKQRNYVFLSKIGQFRPPRRVFSWKLTVSDLKSRPFVEKKSVGKEVLYVLAPTEGVPKGYEAIRGEMAEN